MYLSEIQPLKTKLFLEIVQILRLDELSILGLKDMTDINTAIMLSNDKQ